MGDWKRVKWTEAGQITRLLGWREEPGLERPPAEYFAELRAKGQLREASMFLAQALPRLESVAWAARSVRDLTNGAARPPAEQAALKAALLWVQDPVDARRRAAREAADAADAASAERYAAMAAFFSGGSITPENCQPVPAAKEVAGRLASGAVLLAAAASRDMKAALAKCLDAGEAIAREGLKTA